MPNIYVYLFVSRAKDNKDVEGFKRREKTILSYGTKYGEIRREFLQFVNEGVPGEKSRFYISVNSRDEEKIRFALIRKLLDFNTSPLRARHLLLSVAQKAENRKDNNWLIDFDCNDEEVFNEFLTDLKWMGNFTEKVLYYSNTVNGYVIVIPNNFPKMKELLDKYKEYDISVKRDALLFLDIEEKQK